jgi:hypothetical protein
MWKVKTKVIPVTIQAGNWNQFKIIQKTPEQNKWKARQQGTTQKGHIGHSKHNFVFFFPVAQQVYSSVSFEIIRRHTQSLGLLWTSDRSITQTST